MSRIRRTQRPSGCCVENLESRQLLTSVASGFVDSLYASGFDRPTQMAFLPDGRLLVAEQGGKLRLVKNGQLVSTPVVSLTVNKAGERGLSGVVADPDFNDNKYIYVYYTKYTGSIAHNRLSRFTMNGDTAALSTERVLMDLEALSSYYHMGGGLHFDSGGKLYVSVGENARGTPAQRTDTTLGKVLRLNKDGTIPTDNPFYNSTTGNNRAIFSLGLRNPFTFAIRPGTQTLFINDVGESSWEEVNKGGAGSNFGWPSSEGPTTNPNFVSPAHAYDHTVGSAVIGADFYPSGGPFPSVYHGKYLFGDHAKGFIKAMDPNSPAIVATLSTGGIEAMTDIDVGPDGAVYYLERTYASAGKVGRIQVANATGAPVVAQQPRSQSVNDGQPVTFTVVATGQAPLSYQWQRNGANIAGATSSSFTITAAASGDNNDRFRVIVSNSQGSITSSEAVLTVVPPNSAPVVTIDAPSSSLTYRAGDTISFSGKATDLQDGTLAASRLTWRIDFHHDTHNHPFMSATSGISGGTFKIPTNGETSANTWFRIHLTATDSDGNSSSTFREVFPRKRTLTVRTSVAGLTVHVNAQPKASPYSFRSVINFPHTISVNPTQVKDGITYQFRGWSDGVSDAVRQVNTPSEDTTYTANFTAANAPAITKLSPIADTHVRGGGDAGRNFGSASEIQVKSDPTATYTRQAFFKFDLANSGTIGSAILRLYGRLSSADGTVKVGVYAVSDTGWAENSMTWNNRPASSGTVIASSTLTSTSASTKEFDVSAYLRQQKAAGKRYVTLMVAGMSRGAPYAIFNSRQATSRQPELWVNP